MGAWSYTNRAGFILKGNTDNQDIGLLEVLWKVMEAVIGTRIKKTMNFYDVLHGFFEGRGTSISIMEIKLAQKLASVDQDPLFLVLLYLRKLYDNLHRGCLFQTL